MGIPMPPVNLRFQLQNEGKIILDGETVNVHNAKLCDCPPGTLTKSFAASVEGHWLYLEEAHFISEVTL